MTNTATYTGTNTLLPTNTGTNTETYTETVIITNTPINTATETETNTATLLLTSTPTLSYTNTNTLIPTATFTNTQSYTPITTNTGTNTRTSTQTFTFTPTNTFTNTIFITSTPSITATKTPEPEKDEFKINEIKIYPNPYKQENGDLKIKFIISKKCNQIQVKIYTSALRLIRKFDLKIEPSTNNGIITVEKKYLSDLSGGVYFVLITAVDNSGNKVTGKPEKIINIK
jgi:hypothetical protein